MADTTRMMEALIEKAKERAAFLDPDDYADIVGYFDRLADFLPSLTAELAAVRKQNDAYREALQELSQPLTHTTNVIEETKRLYWLVLCRICGRPIHVERTTASASTEPPNPPYALICAECCQGVPNG